MSLFQTTYDPLSKTWSGRPMAPIYHPNVNAAQVLLDAMHRSPKLVAQINVNNGVRLTNEELATNTVRVAQHLDRLGIRSGDVITLMAGNHHDVASVVFAGFALGAPINILGKNFTTDELTHMLRMTTPRIVFCEPTNIDCVRLALEEVGLAIPIYTFNKHETAASVDELLLATGTEKDFRPTLLVDGQKHAAVILCSSGTTGPPKGIPVSHATILYQFNEQLDLTLGDVYYVPGSLVWITAVIGLISSTLRGATRVITETDVSPEMSLQIFEKYRVTSSFISLYTLALMLQSPLIETVDLSHMKRLGCGGSVMSDAHRGRMNQLLPNGYVYVVYGLSEVPGYMAVSQSAEPASTVGLLCPGQEFRVLDDSGLACGPNEDGELATRGEMPIMGYWNDESNTKNLFTDDGWALTGDIGHFDADGFLFLTDRKKEMLKYRGRNISPSLVENALLTMAGVAAVCVVGVVDDDVEELPTALVVLDDREEVTELMINRLVEDTLAEKDFLCGGIYFVDKLPKTHSGKVQRRGVRTIATQLYNDRFGENVDH